MFRSVNNFFLKNSPFVLILFNLCFYLPIIFSSLGFIDDDFVIFSYIKNNIDSPIITDPLAQYFLFVRPLSYFSLWLDYLLFQDNYVAIKLISLIYHISFIISFYYLSKKIISLFKLKVSESSVILICMILSIHLDCLRWISWICNRTEQLMILFYVLSLISFIKYLDNKKGIYLLLTAILFLMSVLSKQSSLHLPIIFLFYLIFNKTINSDNKKSYILFFIFGITIIIISSAFNIYFYQEHLGIFENLWKKPFTMVGIMIHSIIPIFSNQIYNYFTINKSTAVFIFAGAILFFIYILWRLPKSKRTVVYSLFIFIAIIFFPRIFAVGSQRLNGILLFWLAILLIYITGYFQKKQIINVILVSILFFYAFSFISRTVELFAVTNFKEEKFKKLLSYIESKSGKTLILCSDTYDIIPYKYHYYTHKSFGKSDIIYSSPIFYELVMVNHKLDLFNKDFITCTKEGDNYKITSEDPLIYLLIYQKDINSDKIKIISKIESDSGRGYKELIINLKNIMNENITNIVYFTGTNWVELK